jgi:hypothetical protein
MIAGIIQQVFERFSQGSEALTEKVRIGAVAATRLQSIAVICAREIHHEPAAPRKVRDKAASRRLGWPQYP